MTRLNDYGQSVGDPLPDWVARPRPPRRAIEGRFCRVEPIDPALHAEALFEAFRLTADGRNWTYLPVEERPDDPAAFARQLGKDAASEDPLHFAVIDKAQGKAVGRCSYLRIVPEHGVIEIGHICWSPLLQRRPASTEAAYLMMRRAFDELGYRRFEWKCDALNEPSRAAAARFGFSFEGVFRQAMVTKGRNRDTAWYSVIDGEWPAVREAFEAWLAPENFDAEGRQRQALAAIRRSREPEENEP